MYLWDRSNSVAESESYHKERNDRDCGIFSRNADTICRCTRSVEIPDLLSLDCKAVPRAGVRTFPCGEIYIQI